jgi:hypothetical protein
VPTPGFIRTSQRAIDGTAMFKFLRKYNKIILAVGGTLLLIVFLIPQAIQQLSQQAALRSADIATVGWESDTVSVVEWNQVQMETQVLERLGLQLPPIGVINNAQHWYLLSREAEQLGFVPPLPTGAFVFPDEALGQIAGAFSGVTPTDIQRTIARFQGVSRMINTFVQAGEMSDLRLQQYAQRLFHCVGLATVAIKADAEKSDVTPTEQQLQAQLDLYKDVMPGEGAHGFGYKLPDRAKLEWLTVSADSVRDAVRNSERMSGRELRRHWRDNVGRNGIPEVETGVAVPDAVFDDLLEQLTRAELDQIEKFTYDQIRIPQRELTRSSGFYVLPASWPQQRVDMQSLAGQIAERFSIETPSYTAPGDEWLTIADLNEIDGIGQSSTDKFGSLATTLSSIVAKTQEFGGDGTLPIQQGIAGPPLRHTDGTLYLFRIVDTDPSRAPASVDEVRQQVVHDLRRQAHYEQLAARVDEIQQIARDSGLLAVALQHDSEVAADKRAALYEPDKFYIDGIMGRGLSAMPSQVPGLGDAPALMEQIIDWARTFPQLIRMNTIPAAERTRVFTSDDQLAVIAVLLTDQFPLTAEDYRKLMTDNELEVLLLNDELDDSQAISDAFSLETMVQRHNFKLNQTADPDDLDDESADSSSDA